MQKTFLTSFIKSVDNTKGMKMMKKLLSLTLALLLCLLPLTGCSSTKINGKWDYSKQSLLEFNYGCSIEDAESYFGLTEADRYNVYVSEDQSTTYGYDISDWNIGADMLKIHNSVEQIGDSTIDSGIITFTFVFDGKENEQKMLDFFQKQIDCCSDSYALTDTDFDAYYGYGDWASYKDSAFVSYYTALEPLDEPFESLRGTAFDADTWNKGIPLVASYHYNFTDLYGYSTDAPELSDRHEVVFNGIYQAYALADDWQ